MAKRLQTVPTGAIFGVHYLRDADGRAYPLVRGGDGPDDGDHGASLVELVTQAEGDLATLSDDELGELHEQLAAGYRDARGNVENDEQVEALRSVVQAVQTVAGEQTRRTEAAATEQAEAEAAATRRAEALAALDADVDATLAAEGEDGAGGGDGGGDGGAGGDDGDGDDEDGDGDEGAGGEDGDEGAGGDGEGQGGQAGSQQASAGRRAPMAALASLQTGRGARQQQRRQRGEETGPQAGQLAGRIAASASLGMFEAGHHYGSVEELGRTLAALRTDLQVDSPTLKKHVVGRTRIADAPHVVQASEFAGQPDADVIGEAVRRTTEARQARVQAILKAGRAGASRRVASGGICAPAMPNYAITVVGDGGTPFVDSLPTVASERPMSYFPDIVMSLNDAAGSRPGAKPTGGFGSVTAAQDAAGYGGTNFAGTTRSIPTGGHAYKDCVKIDCPQPVTSTPESSFLCVTIGQFQAITFKEYVDAFTKVTHNYYDVYRDERAMGKVIAAAHHVHGSSNTFGASRDVLTKLRRLAAFIRSDRHDPDMPLDVRVPAWALTMIANDIAVSFSDDPETNLSYTPAMALALLAAQDNIMVDIYDVDAGTTLGGSPTLLPQQGAGELEDWPAEVRLLVWAEGAVFQTTYGELSFGLRETGMQTNDYSTFEEVFEQTSTRNPDIFTLDLAVCENGAQGAAVAVTCNG